MLAWVRLRGAAQPPEREMGPGIGAGRMIGRSENAIGNHARDRARPPSTAVRHVGQAAQADIHLEGFINVERRWRTRARNVVGRVQVILT